MNQIQIWITLLLIVVLTACDNASDTKVTVDEYAIDTEEASAIPNEIYDKDTALIQDNITYTIDDYDERLRLMEEEILSKSASERSSLEARNARLRLSLDTLKVATQYPNGVMPTDEAERLHIERILE